MCKIEHGEYRVRNLPHFAFHLTVTMRRRRGRGRGGGGGRRGQGKSRVGGGGEGAGEGPFLSTDGCRHLLRALPAPPHHSSLQRPSRKDSHDLSFTDEETEAQRD